MSTAIPNPEPTPEDVERGLIELEQHLAEKAPTAPRVEQVETKRVRELRAEVAEAHALLDLQDDDAPLLVDTPKVRQLRKKAAEAVQLHALAQNSAARAWQAARVRRWLTAAGLVSLALALSWSTAGVHEFAAEGAAAWSPGWVFAWLVEPFLSLALLTVVGAKAYAGTRGQPITSPALDRIEWLFLGLTLGMNAWRHLPGIADQFSLSRLVLHILGPVVAVAIVRALPIILAAFTGLQHGATGTPGTGPSYRANAASEYPSESARTGHDIAALAQRVRRLIAAGELPPDPGVKRIREALRIGTDTARQVRDQLTHGGAA